MHADLVEHEFETRRFDQRILMSSGTTASGLEEESLDLWKQEDADATFVGPDGSLYSIQFKFDSTRKDEAIVWWPSLNNGHFADSVGKCMYFGSTQNMLNDSSIVLSRSLVSEYGRTLENLERLALTFARIWKVCDSKLEAVHPITKAAYVRLSEMPASSYAREAIAPILSRFAEVLPLTHTIQLPALRLALLEDSCYLLEWTFKNRRLGFAFETDPKDSGWYYVFSDGSSERYESGTMDQLELNRLIDMATKA